MKRQSQPVSYKNKMGVKIIWQKNKFCRRDFNISTKPETGPLVTTAHEFPEELSIFSFHLWYEGELL